MKNLISNSTDHLEFVGATAAAQRHGRRTISFLLAVTVMGAACALPFASPASAATLSGASFSSTQSVQGSPRVSRGHPYTLWDAEDVAAYKASFATDPKLKAAFDELRAWGDKRITDPINVPSHRLEA